jgi:phosphoadenosine phosphosulfate reductase
VPFFEARAEHDFHQLVEYMGPPSRKMRWCCTIFKAGPINNFLQTLGDHVKVLTFYGVRRAESVQRADYNAVTVGAKIGNQVTASPVIDWTEFDIWLYILSHGMLFNDSYRLGYSRVGCWLCPLNSRWSDMLAEIFFPENSERWRQQLLAFARRLGKPDPEVYVAEKGWASRFGGAGLPNRWTGIDARPCGDMDNTVEYTVTRPVSDELFEFFKPLGRINRERGREALGEFFVESGKGRGFDLLVQAVPGSDTIRVTVLDPTRADEIQRYVKYQVNKFQTCIQCTACSAACPYGAITVRPKQRVYEVNLDKCVHCNECVIHFGSTGCLVAKSLSSYGEADIGDDFIPLAAVAAPLSYDGHKDGSACGISTP